MSSLKSWLRKSFTENRARAERRISPGLEAIHYVGSDEEQNTIKDISATGIFLYTDRRWPSGTMIPLTLKSKHLSREGLDLQVSIQAKAVRWSNEGIGLSFVLPEGMELRLWKSELESPAEQTEPEEILREFRVARALGFLHRICPSAWQQIDLLFREGLSNVRIASAVEIALYAEKMIEREPNSDKLHAPSILVMRIISDGSWAEIDDNLKLWAGLLATSCTMRGEDESNLSFVEIMSQLANIHTRIFIAACTQAKKTVSGPDSITAQPVTCTAEELARIAGAHDLVKIDRNLTQLCDLGLLAERAKTRFFSYNEDASITPTTLGLQMYKICQGHRGSLRDFYGSAVENAPALATNR